MTRVRKSSAGFTLIELIVVIALIAIGVALVGPRRMRSDSSSLRQAEIMVASLLRTARSTGILTTRDARLVIDWDLTSPTYLRALAVVADDDAGGWTFVAPLTILPENVAVVPGEPVPVMAGVTWNKDVVSEMTGTMTLSVAGRSTLLSYMNFTPAGGTANGNKIVIALCKQEEGTPKFYTTDWMRAFLMRTSGVATMLQDPASL